MNQTKYQIYQFKMSSTNDNLKNIRYQSVE